MFIPYRDREGGTRISNRQVSGYELWGAQQRKQARCRQRPWAGRIRMVSHPGVTFELGDEEELDASEGRCWAGARRWAAAARQSRPCA